MRGFNILKAKEMFLNMLKWREDCSVDAIANVCGVFIVLHFFYLWFVTRIYAYSSLPTLLYPCCKVHMSEQYISYCNIELMAARISFAGILLFIKFP